MIDIGLVLNVIFSEIGNMLKKCPPTLLLLFFLVAATESQAHSFGVVYTLPLPFWLYAWGAVAALVTSFLVLIFVDRERLLTREGSARDISDTALIKLLKRWQLLKLLKLLSLGSLLFCIATGFWGVRSPYGNFNMTFFWIVFVLGFSYATVVFGNLYAAINPWQFMIDILARIKPSLLRGCVRYPSFLAFWPALFLYIGFIWFELFAQNTPFTLAVLLAGYTALNILGVALIGRHNWFEYCEFFSIFFRLLAVMAPIDYKPSDAHGEGGHLRLRIPFSGVLAEPPQQLSLLVFVLFMLSSTAFDGLHETVVWKKLFWLDFYHGFLQYWTDTNPFVAFAAMSRLYSYWQGLCLLLSPFLYLLVFAAFIAMGKFITKSPVPVKVLLFRFSYSLLPIALVYHVAHYYTLIQTQGIKIVSLVSDPFGWGSNWFGTANWLQRVFIPDTSTTWHVQLTLIIVGHIASVYVSHVLALRSFVSSRNATLSQLPLLLLMLVFTVSGLWILSQPIGS